MSNNLSKKQLKRIAKMHIASVIINIETTLAFSDLSYEEIAYLEDYYEKTGLRIIELDPLLYDADEIVKYVRDNV